MSEYFFFFGIFKLVTPGQQPRAEGRSWTPYTPLAQVLGSAFQYDRECQVLDHKPTAPTFFTYRTGGIFFFFFFCRCFFSNSGPLCLRSGACSIINF